MAATQQPPGGAKSLVSGGRKYRPLGFSKGSFSLFFFFGGWMMLFSVTQMKKYIDTPLCSDLEKSIPGECYWFGRGFDRLGMLIHLAAVLPAGFLACLQFIPPLQRRKFVLFHRVNGYAVLVLSVVGSVGALIITKHAVGGDLVFQACMVLSVCMFLFASAKAYVSIKQGRIDEHREWMLRAWFYAGFVVTMRPVLIAVAKAVSGPDSQFYQFIPCKVIDFILSGSHERISQLAPGCAAYLTGGNPEQWTAVQADWTDDNPVGKTAALRIGFHFASWVCFAIHAIGVEIYLRMTSAESERLKLLSKHRKMHSEQARSDK